MKVRMFRTLTSFDSLTLIAVSSHQSSLCRCGGDKTKQLDSVCLHIKTRTFSSHIFLRRNYVQGWEGPLQSVFREEMAQHDDDVLLWATHKHLAKQASRMCHVLIMCCAKKSYNNQVAWLLCFMSIIFVDVWLPFVFL